MRSNDDPELVARLRDVLARHPEQALHDVVWSFREGRIDRRRLLTHPAFARAMRADAAALRQRLAEEGHPPERVRARLLAALTAAGAYPPGPGEPDVLAPADPPEPGP